MSKVIATIGPVTENRIRELSDLGVQIFRLNLSHNSLEWHLNVINNIRRITPSSSILADIPGRKIRTTSKVSKEKFNKGKRIYLVSHDFTKDYLDSNFIYEINNNSLFKMVKKGTKIYADDGRLSFEVESVEDKYITLISNCEGTLKECKGINIPESSFGKEELTEKDKYFLDFCCNNKIDFVGISFVDKADYMIKIQNYISERHPKAIAKIENTSAMNNLSGQSTSNPTSISQKAAIEAFSGNQDKVVELLGEFEIRKEYISSFLNEIEGVECFVPKGAFYVFPDISYYFGKSFKGKEIRNSIEFTDFLLDHAKVAVVPGIEFGSVKHIRISYATSMNDIKEGTKRIKESLQDLL